MKKPDLFFENTSAVMERQVIHLLNDEAPERLMNRENKRRAKWLKK